MQQQLFSLGRVVATPGALQALAERATSPLHLINRHVAGDWGDIDPEDRGLNEQALQTGARIFSVYKLTEAETIWVITNGDDDDGHRDATTLLLPSEY